MNEPFAAIEQWLNKTEHACNWDSVDYKAFKQAHAELEAAREKAWALEILMDSIGALSNPSELCGMGISERNQKRICAACQKPASGRQE